MHSKVKINFLQIKELIFKIKFKIRQKIVLSTFKKPYFNYLYTSFWHSIFIKQTNLNSYKNNYFTTYPNYGAGIGHQMSNWISGYWWSKRFGLNYVHIPFPNQTWESFLGFGENEIKINELISRGYSKVLLPMFDENSIKDFDKIKRIMQSYGNKKIIFIAEQDQGFKNHYEVMNDLKQKFYNASSRKNDNLIYTEQYFNIAIHVRRGDIVVNSKNKNENLKMRWQDNSYFLNVLKQVTTTIKFDKPIKIHLFSQGEQNQFREFEEFKNISYCLDISTQDSFLHMVKADLLITSKSSFSYKPALINSGIKICPADFWLGYPQKTDWILVNDNGEFDKLKLLKNFE